MRRAKAFILRVSDEERARLDALAAERGITRADVIRLLLRGEIRVTSLAPLEQAV